MDGAAHEAEHGAGHHKPAAPCDHLRAAHAGARGAGQAHERDHDARERGGRQPRPLRAPHAVEQARDAGLAPHAGMPGRDGGAAGARASRDDGALHGAGYAPEAVVAKGKLKKRVCLRAADVRAHARGHEHGEQHPPAGARHERAHGSRAVKQPAAHGGGACHQEGNCKPGQDQERLQLLGEERDAARDAGERHPRGAAPVAAGRGLELQRAQHAVHACDQQQHQQGVRVVEAEHQARDGRGGERRARKKPRAVAKLAADRGTAARRRVRP